MDEDVILPDDFEATPSEETQDQPQDQQEEQVESVEDTKPTEETSTPVEQPKIKIKYNHEEQEITLDEAVELAQKGKNYDKLQEKVKSFESDPRLSFVDEMAKEYGMTTEQFLQAAREQREQARLNELIQQNIPEEYAKEILENRKFREQFQTKEKEQQEQQKQSAMFSEFVEAFPGVKAEDIPQTVWDNVSKGVPLKYAYLEHEMSALKTKIQVYEQNEKNTKKAPVGSVTAHGGSNVGADDDFLKGFNSI